MMGWRRRCGHARRRLPGGPTSGRSPDSTDGVAVPPQRHADRDTVRLVAEYSAFEEIAILCAHLASTDPRFAIVGRHAEDQQYRRRVLLATAGFDLPRPDERTAEIFGRTYQLPDVTASVVRELATNIPAAIVPPGNPDESGILIANHSEETTMQVPIDPNAKLNGPHPAAPEEGTGFLAFMKRQCTVRNGVIAGAVVLIGTALYFALTNGNAGDVPEIPTTA